MTLQFSPAAGAGVMSLSTFLRGPQGLPGAGGISTYLAKTANYAVLNADNAKTIGLGGSTLFTLTFGAASTYDAQFFAIVVNEDSTRGKIIAINGLSNFILWPLQVMTIINMNNTWQVNRPSRWKVPGGTLTVFTDFSNGTDASAATDGLASGTSAFKTVSGALWRIFDQFDWNGDGNVGPTLVIIQMAAGSTDTTAVHFSSHSSMVGAGGSAGITINMNGGTLNCATSDTIQVYYGTIIQIRNGTIASTGGSGIVALYGAKVFVLDAVTFGVCASAAIETHIGGTVTLSNNFTISGNVLYFINALQHTYVEATVAVTATLSANIIVTDTVRCDDAFVGLANVTWSLGGHTVTGTKYVVTNNGVLNGSANIPGSVAGSTSTGGQAS